MVGRNGWSEEEVIVLANATPKEFYDVFKSEQGEHLTHYVDTVIKFGRFFNASEQQRKIADNATQALRTIAKESPINERRVRKFGIQIDSALDNESGDA
jgi:hypothetical protein